MHTKQERNIIREIVKQCHLAGKKREATVQALNDAQTFTAAGNAWDLKALTNFKSRNKRFLALGLKTIKRKKTKKDAAPKVYEVKTSHTRDTDALTLIELVMGAKISNTKKLEVIERLVK
jgi:hypothetical protein